MEPRVRQWPPLELKTAFTQYSSESTNQAFKRRSGVYQGKYPALRRAGWSTDRAGLTLSQTQTPLRRTVTVPNNKPGTIIVPRASRYISSPNPSRSSHATPTILRAEDFSPNASPSRSLRSRWTSSYSHHCGGSGSSQIANNIISSGLERRHHKRACTRSFAADSAVQLSQRCSAQLQLRGMTSWTYGNSPFKLTKTFSLRNGRHTHTLHDFTAIFGKSRRFRTLNKQRPPWPDSKEYE